MKRIIGLSALAIVLLALLFGCAFPLTLDQRIQQFATDLNLADRSNIYLNFHSTLTVNYDAIRDPAYFDASLPPVLGGDTPYVISITGCH